jgi:hypothetical protein
MAVLSIVGVARGIGKTSVAEMLLSRLTSWHAARVRVADEVPEERLSLLGNRGYALLTAPGGEEDPTHEMRRLTDAGAKTAAELLAEPLGLREGLKALRRTFPPDADLLIEGNAFLWGDHADLAVMVVGPGESGRGLAPVRASVRELIPRIDLWVWNTRGRPGDEGFFDFPQAFARGGFRRTVSNAADFHHVNPEDDTHGGNAEFLEALAERLERLGVGPGSVECLRGPNGRDTGHA